MNDLLDHIPRDGVTLRCGAGVHHACPSCECSCHDRQPELPGMSTSTEHPTVRSMGPTGLIFPPRPGGAS